MPDYVLFHKPNLPIAVIEAKDNKHSLGDSDELMAEYQQIVRQLEAVQQALKAELTDCLEG